jgi:hypothetical protein
MINNIYSEKLTFTEWLQHFAYTSDTSETKTEHISKQNSLEEELSYIDSYICPIM